MRCMAINRFVWSDKLKGMARLRVITNYLTRMRFVDAKAGMELETKSEPEKAPKGYNPGTSFPVRMRRRLSLATGLPCKVKPTKIVMLPWIPAVFGGA